MIRRIYNKRFIEVKDFLTNNPIYIIFDETTDSCVRYILNVLIGKCSVQLLEKPFLYIWFIKRHYCSKHIHN